MSPSGDQPIRLAGQDALEAHAEIDRLRAELRDSAKHETILHAAAAKLDAQAAAHGEGIHDYTDLLRIWASDAARWCAGE